MKHMKEHIDDQCLAYTSKDLLTMSTMSVIFSRQYSILFTAGDCRPCSTATIEINIPQAIFREFWDCCPLNVVNC